MIDLQALLPRLPTPSLQGQLLLRDPCAVSILQELCRAYPQGAPGNSCRVLVGALCFSDQLIHAELLLRGCSGLPVIGGTLEKLITRGFNAFFATPLLLRAKHFFLCYEKQNPERMEHWGRTRENTI